MVDLKGKVVKGNLRKLRWLGDVRRRYIRTLGIDDFRFVIDD